MRHTPCSWSTGDAVLREGDRVARTAQRLRGDGHVDLARDAESIAKALRELGNAIVRRYPK